jgi:signal recognition particle subunit SRP54
MGDEPTAGRSLLTRQPDRRLARLRDETIFDTLANRLQAVFKELARRGKLRQRDVRATLEEIRLALLEADVHYEVVKTLVERIETRIVGSASAPGLNPAETVIRAVHGELIEVLGEPQGLKLDGPRPRVILLVGLQGSGKTTTAAKLAKQLRDDGERVNLIAADLQRPAAVKQLQVLGDRIGASVFTDGRLSAPRVAEEGVRKAKEAGASVAIVDSAGRSQLDEAMMAEIKAVSDAVAPVEAILVADAMTGQEAVSIAQGFSDRLELTGLILSKMDGDARGGAAISIRWVTGIPIKYVGTGEGLDDLALFKPNRMASRILGLGDIESLAERAEATLDPGQAKAQIRRLERGDFTLEDFASQLDQVRRLGPLGKVMELLPAQLSPGTVAGADPAQIESQLLRIRAIIGSMTREERVKPKVLNGSRKRRIAAGSGTTVQEVNQLLRQYRQMQKQFKAMGRGGLSGLMPGLK